MQIYSNNLLSSSLTTDEAETVDHSPSPLAEKKIMTIPPIKQWGLSDYLSYYAKPASIAADCICCITLATLLITPLGKISLLAFTLFASSTVFKVHLQQKHM
jgi:hypothetical protein